MGQFCNFWHIHNLHWKKKAQSKHLYAKHLSTPSSPLVVISEGIPYFLFSTNTVTCNKQLCLLRWTSGLNSKVEISHNHTSLSFALSNVLRASREGCSMFTILRSKLISWLCTYMYVSVAAMVIACMSYHSGELYTSSALYNSITACHTVSNIIYPSIASFKVNFNEIIQQ